MIKTLKVFLLVFSLGIFLIPQNSYFEKDMDSCCSTEASLVHDCSNDQHEDSKKGNSNEENCGDHCKFCGTCHPFAALYFFQSPEFTDDFPRMQHRKAKFTYITPEFSNIYSKVWQPPKIG